MIEMNIGKKVVGSFHEMSYDGLKVPQQIDTLLNKIYIQKDGLLTNHDKLYHGLF